VTDPDLYKVLGDGPEVEVKVKGSRFLGQAFHASDIDAVKDRLASIRKKHHAATHHCWAARWGAPDLVAEQADDDGEPSGTAGVPILAPLKGRGLHDGLIVVTRYFGGTKLGTGGLARAYSQAALAALDGAPVTSGRLLSVLRAEVDWDDLGALEAVLARSAQDLFRVDRAFEAGPRVTLTLKRSRAERFQAELVESLAGRIKFLEK
jgi:uncharacterized YigZ family protein